MWCNDHSWNTSGELVSEFHMTAKRTRSKQFLREETFQNSREPSINPTRIVKQKFRLYSYNHLFRCSTAFWPPIALSYQAVPCFPSSVHPVLPMPWVVVYSNTIYLNSEANQKIKIRKKPICGTQLRIARKRIAIEYSVVLLWRVAIYHSASLLVHDP